MLSGGVYSYGTGNRFSDIIVKDNTAGAGGGVVFEITSTGTMTNSVIFNNTSTGGTDDLAGVGGGGLLALRAAVVLENVTISGNTAPNGAGIQLVDRATLTANNLTVVNNEAALSTGGIQEYKNEEFLEGSSVNLSNSIVALNTAPVAPNCNLTLTSTGDNLIGDDSGCTAASSDLVDTNPLIEPLSPEGNTFVHPLQANSPAIDAGTNGTCEASDQRGITRPQGAACDLGAYEREVPSTPTPSPTLEPTLTATSTNTPTLEPSFTATSTSTPTIEPSATATSTNTVTIQPSATATSTSTPTVEPTATVEPSTTATTVSPTVAPTEEPTVSATDEVTPPTDEPTFTATLTPAATAIPATASPTASATKTATSQPTLTPRPTQSSGNTIELLVNGGFENDLTGWTPLDAKEGDKRVCNRVKRPDGLPDKIVARSGSCAFQFKGTNGELSKLRQLVSTTGVNTGDTLMLSGFYKASGAVNAKVKVRVKYANTALGIGKVTVSLGEGAGYAAFAGNLQLAVAGEVSALKVVLQERGTSGNVFFDDLSLKLTDGAGLLPLS